ncbi:MAG: beta-propeller domain-containing protein [Saccharofermentanales bacterium]
MKKPYFLIQNKKLIGMVSVGAAAILLASFLPFSGLFQKKPADSQISISDSSAIITSSEEAISKIPTKPETTSAASISKGISSATSSKVISNNNVKTKGTVTNKNVTIQTINQEKKLPKFKSYQEILTLLRSMGVSYSGYYKGGIDTSTSQTAENGAKTAMPATAGSFQADHSSTNTQVSGIDEGDIIKNDGKYLYIAKQNTVSIVYAYPAEIMKKAGTISLEQNESVQELYLKGNLLTIIGNSYDIKTITIDPPASDPAKSAASSETSSKATVSAVAPETKEMMPAIWRAQKQLTIVRVYDVTDRTAPVLKRSLSFDGYLVSSREKDGRFYVITNRMIYDFPEEYVKMNDVLPAYSDSAVSKTPIIIKAESVEYCPENVTANYLLISCFDIDTQEPATVETILGAGNTVYMSNTALYIIQPYFRYTLKEEPVTSGTESKAAISGTSDTITGTTGIFRADVYDIDEGTVVMKFGLAGQGVKFTVAGKVPGQVLNQYSMDEFNGAFRIATTKQGMQTPSNNVYALDTTLKVTGKIENLAPGERIYAVRFVGKTGYVVTFRNMDPLFVIDLSNPASLKLLGELKIPGFSNYLHPVSPTLLMGIGQNTVTLYRKDENGNEVESGSVQSGLKVSLFDVSDPKNPKEVDSLVFGGAGSNTEAQYNPRAFVWWNTQMTALFPAYLNGEDGGTSYDKGAYESPKSGALAVSVVGNTLKEKARLFPENAEYGYYGYSRVVYINNIIYISMNSNVYAYDATTLKEISRCAS